LSPAWRAVAGLAAALALFGAGWLAAGALGGGGDAYAVVLQDGAAFMEVSGDTSAERVTVTMDGLDRLPAGRAYQVWAVRDDGWHSIGTCNTDADGWWRGRFDFQIEEGEAVALTVEPAGGSERPSGEPILQSVLR
jgi:anti-sigma-K factor RskA